MFDSAGKLKIELYKFSFSIINFSERLNYPSGIGALRGIPRRTNFDINPFIINKGTPTITFGRIIGEPKYSIALDHLLASVLLKAGNYESLASLTYQIFNQKD